MPQPSPSSPRLPEPNLDAALRHSEWLQQLARGLARDDSSAHDLVQRVWLAALKKPPEQGTGSVRSWLAAVLRNEARMERRSSERRRAREQFAAPLADEQPGAAEELAALDERLELQQQLITAVQALDQPFRTTVVLRYLEQQTVAEISRRTSAPIRTVEARLRRGRELLRQKLDGHFGDRATWATLAIPLVAPLASPLADSSQALSRLLPSVPSTTAAVAMTTKALLAALAIICLIAASQLLRDSEPSTSASGVHAMALDEAPPGSVPASSVELVTINEKPARAPGTSPVEVAELEAPVQESLGAAAYDADAKTTLRLRVVDPDGLPVPDAVIRISGMRSVTNEGSWYDYRGTEPLGRSGPDGWVSLEHFVWVNQDGQVCAVDLNVEHPEFVPLRDSRFSLDTDVVVLQRGATVVCTAWFRDQSTPILDLQVQADRQSGVGRSSWAPLADGRLATSRFAPGTHCVTVSIEHPELGRLYSMPTTFEVGEVGWETLHLQLMEPVRLEGELDARVPRPVVDGRVLAVFRGGGTTYSSPLVSSEMEVEVAPDGTFVLENARPGKCFLFALAEGWTVQRGRPATLEEAGIELTDETNTQAAHDQLAALPRERFVYPSVDLPMSAEPYVLPMEPTGSLELTVMGPDGPLRNANTNVSPSYRVHLVGSAIVPWRDWSGRTDANGMVRFDDLPFDASLSVAASAEGLRMSAEDRKSLPSAPIQPGETSSLEIILEPIE